jgi:hypothetical protein
MCVYSIRLQRYCCQQYQIVSASQGMSPKYRSTIVGPLAHPVKEPNAGSQLSLLLLALPTAVVLLDIISASAASPWCTSCAHMRKHLMLRKFLCMPHIAATVCQPVTECCHACCVTQHRRCSAHHAWHMCIAVPLPQLCSIQVGGQTSQDMCSAAKKWAASSIASWNGLKECSKCQLEHYSELANNR